MDRGEDEGPIRRDVLGALDPEAEHQAAECQQHAGDRRVEPTTEARRWLHQVLAEAHATSSDLRLRGLGAAALGTHARASTICSTISSTSRSLVSTDRASAASDSGLATRFESSASRLARSLATVS